MRIMLLIALVLLIIEISSYECISNYYFYNLRTYARNPEASLTFADVNQALKPLQQYSYKVSQDTTTYTLFSPKVTFSYDVNRQVATKVDDIMMVQKGILEIKISFDYQRDGPSSFRGSVQAYLNSSEFVYAKRLVVGQSFLSYKLVDYEDLRINQPVITSIKSDIQNDKLFISLMIDKLNGLYTFRQQLQDQIKNLLGAPLKARVEPFIPTLNTFVYKWTPLDTSKQSTSITFTRKPYDISNIFYMWGFEWRGQSKIQDDPKWVCGKREVPPIRTTQYAPAEEDISLDYFQNILKYLARKGTLDSSLNGVNWANQYFRFIAQDLYKFMTVASSSPPYALVTGKCQHKTSDEFLPKIQKGQTRYALNVILNYDCSLSIEGKEVGTFEVKWNAITRPYAFSNQLNFQLTDFVAESKFDHNFFDKAGAGQLLSMVMRNLLEGWLLGEGWPLAEMRGIEQATVMGDYISIIAIE